MPIEKEIEHKKREKKRRADKQKRDEAKNLEAKKDYLHIQTLKTNAIELFTNRQERSEKSDELQNECGQKFVTHKQHANRKRDRAPKKERRRE